MVLTPIFLTTSIYSSSDAQEAHPSPPGITVNSFGPVLTIPPADPYSLGLGYKTLQRQQSVPVEFNLSQGPSMEAAKGMLNTAVGHFSLQALTQGEYNTCVGEVSCYNMTSGSNNVAVGQQALFNATGGTSKEPGHGSNNVAIGQGAGFNITTGQANTLVGTNTGLSITTGALNVEVGIVGGPGGPGCPIDAGIGNILVGNAMKRCGAGAASFTFDIGDTLWGNLAENAAGGMLNVQAHVNSKTGKTNPPPSLSACGDSPRLAEGSTDTAGQITTGKGASPTCTVSFGVPYGAAPFCSVTPETAEVTAYLSRKTAAAFTIGLSAGKDNIVIDYICIGSS